MSNPPEFLQLFYYLPAAFVLHLAVETAKVLLDDSLWTHPPYPAWRDILLCRRRSRRSLFALLLHHK